MIIAFTNQVSGEPGAAQDVLDVHAYAPHKATGMTSLTERLAKLTATADRLLAREQIREAQREIALANRRDPSPDSPVARLGCCQRRAETSA